MDQLGDFKLSWAIGYDGSPVHYVNETTLAFLSVTCVKFHNKVQNTAHYLHPPSGRVLNKLAVNSHYQYLACAEDGVDANIFVYYIKDLSRPLSTLNAGVGLGYNCVEFANNGKFLVSCTNIPDVQINIWDYTMGTSLCTLAISAPVTNLKFNPANWRQLSGVANSRFSLWTVNQVNEYYFIQEKYADLGVKKRKEVYVDASGDENDGSSDEEEDYVYKKVSKKSYKPISQCWAPGNRIYVGCSNNEIVSFDADTGTGLVVYRAAAGESRNFSCLYLHKTGLFTGGKDGVLRCFEVHRYKLVPRDEQVAVSQPITSLQLSTQFSQLAISTDQGCVFTLDTRTEELERVIDEGYGKIIGLHCLNDSNFLTCRKNGLLQIWDSTSAKCVGKIKIDVEVMCLLSPLSSSTAFLATSHGSIVVVDCAKVNAPRLVFEKHLYKAPILKLACDNTGSLLVAGSSDGNVFLLNPLLSSQLNVLGFTVVSGSAVCMSCLSLDANSWKVVLGVTSVANSNRCKQLVTLETNRDLFQNNTDLYMDNTLLLKDASVCKQTFLVKSEIYEIYLSQRNVAFALVHQRKAISKFVLSEYKEGSQHLVLDAVESFPGHAMYGGTISPSAHNKWFVSSAQDGCIYIHDTENMTKPASIVACSYREGGLCYASFGTSASTLFAVTETGHVFSWQWEVTGTGKTCLRAVTQACKRLVTGAVNTRSNEDVLIKNMKEQQVCKDKDTWLQNEVKKSHTEEDKKYSDLKRILRGDIQRLREQLLKFMTENEQVADIEKLERQEFVLDLQERNQIQKERERLLKKLRREIDLKKSGLQYVAHLIAQECLENMTVKGRSLKGFANKFKVVNFPLQKLSEAYKRQLEEVQSQRKLEECERKTRASLKETNSMFSLIEEGEEGEASATYGSLGRSYAGYNENLENQFLLATNMQKKNQIVLLKDCITKIKTQFNKLFDEVYNTKQQEIKRINDRNVRIRKIISDLEMDEVVEDVRMDDDERPESVLVVEDREVDVPKYISEEEQKRIDEQRRIDEEKRRLENADNARGRALEQMMAGRLETNLEEELKKDLEVPEFFSKNKSEWSEEEVKMAKEFEKKNRALQEEREKFKKCLEGELKKLETQKQDALTAFDERLKQLSLRKTKSDMVVAQEELKIVRLIDSIACDKESEKEEQRLVEVLTERKEEKQQISILIATIRREVDEFKDSYELLLADDRTMDKMFRKDFNDLDQFTIDVLYKLFKKRPRGQRNLKATVEESVGGNPFENRPSTAQTAHVALNALESAMTELDAPSHAPENVSTETWAKFVAIRRLKFEKEQAIKSRALMLAEMNSILQKQLDRDEELIASIERIFKQIQRLRGDRFRMNLNLEVQLLLKQGQVEIGNCDFIPDYSNSILIHRSAVENLNTIIKSLGDQKLSKMRVSKEFLKGIHQLAWQLKACHMKCDDLQSTALDLQLLRVTKQLQVFLSDTDQKQSKQQEIATLEKTMEMYKLIHQRNLKERRRTIKKLRCQIREKSDANSELEVELEEMAVCVAERKHIHQNAGESSNEESSESRMNDIITRRKLVDLAKAQSGEINILRMEVERLRMRTFPALMDVNSAV